MTFNALAGDPLGVGSNPLLSMALGVDPITAMLMGQNKERQTANSCVNHCGIPGPRVIGAGPQAPFNPFAVPRATTQHGQIMGATTQHGQFRSVSLSEEDGGDVPISTGFTNDAGMPVHFDADDLKATKKQQEEQEEQKGADVENRVVMLGASQGHRASAHVQYGPPRECGCDAACSTLGNCCGDYWDVCVRF